MTTKPWQIFIWSVAAGAAFLAPPGVGSANAQQPLTATQGVKQASQHKVQVPGTNYEFLPGSFALLPSGENASTRALLAALVAWLSNNFDLPTTNDQPRIVTMSSEKMTRLYYQSFLKNPDYQSFRKDSAEGGSPEEQAQSDQRVVSLYSIPTKTIYLLPDWTGRTPAELSMLIHELVHHLQNVAHTKYTCPEERESVAYEAQEKWLSLFGSDLLSDFKIDRFTLLLSTHCVS
jgi:hypothetical protein